MHRYIMLLAVGLVAFAAGAWLSMRGSVPTERPPEIGGYVLPEPRELPPFELIDARGDPFTPADLRGAWSFIFFGYTHCPDICPLTMAQLARVKGLLDENRVDVNDRYYLVSVDPARDTPPRIHEYVTYFDPEFRGLTGSAPQLDLLTRAAGVVYEVPDAPANDDYLVGHSSSITLIDPEGRIHAFFTSPHEADRIAEDFSVILRDYRDQRT